MENNSNLDPEYGGFFIRLIAFVIDLIIVVLLSLPLWLFVFGALLYVDTVYTLLLWHLKGATLGKMAFGLRVVDANLQKPPFWRLVIRYLAYWISGLLLGLGFIWAIFDERRRGWHDLIAGTVVVKSNSIPESL